MNSLVSLTKEKTVATFHLLIRCHCVNVNELSHLHLGGEQVKARTEIRLDREALLPNHLNY